MSEYNTETSRAHIEACHQVARAQLALDTANLLYRQFAIKWSDYVKAYNAYDAAILKRISTCEALKNEMLAGLRG